MMFRNGALATILLTAMTSVTNAATNTFTDISSMNVKSDFMNAMRSAKIQTERKDRKKRMFRELASKAVPVPKKKVDTTPQRQLERNLYYDDAAAAGGDDAAAADDQYADYGFDISTYSLKYAGCSSIATYSDDLAQDEDATTVFQTDQFVIFRFCPSDTCSGSSAYGCMDDYGEYMLPIADWLETIQAYREEEFERYCAYCEECMGGNNDNRKLDEAAGDDANAAGDDANAAGDDAADAGDDAANAGDDANAAGDDAANAGDDGAAEDGDDAAAAAGDDAASACAYADACSSYADVCYNDDDAAVIDYSNFFQCVEFDVDDENVLYIGPHCASDKSTIVLALFDDQYCSNYVGDEYEINTITNLDLTSETLMQYYNSDCIACKESDLPFQEIDADAEDNDDITEVCENLYDVAAKCNRYIGGATDESYESSEQMDNANVVCNFIKSVVSGSYDEKGYIYYDPSSYSSDNKYNQFADRIFRTDVVTTGQILGLVFLSLLVLVTMFYACILRGTLSKKQTEAIASKSVSRQNSGIMMCRSEATNASGYEGGTMA